MHTQDPYSFDAPFPPPPTGGASTAESSRKPAQQKAKPATIHRFDAELDVSEVDERLRPGSVWTVRGREIGRSRLVFVSRRMCYPNRLLIAAVHLVDDTPMPLFGKTAVCEYEGDGLYRVEIDLIPIPESEQIAAWVVARAK